MFKGHVSKVCGGEKKKSQPIWDKYKYGANGLKIKARTSKEGLWQVRLGRTAQFRTLSDKPKALPVSGEKGL